MVSPTFSRNERTTRHVSNLYGLSVGANRLRRSSFDGTARLWDSVTGECLKVFADHKRPVYALDFSPNGQFLSTGSGDGWLYIYDVKVNILHSVQFAPDNFFQDPRKKMVVVCWPRETGGFRDRLAKSIWS